MSWGRKRVCLALVIALVMVPLAAEDSVFIGDGDIGSIRMYDSQGVPLDATVEVASNIGEGWIIYNPYSPILIITPKGSINLYEDSILVTGDLISDNPSLYLVKGKATFNTYDMGGGTLQVSTPVSLFKLTGDGEMFVITDDSEESVTVFSGEATSYNSITRATRTIGTFHKLGMHEGRAKAKPIATGYYLTYATYPDLMLAKQLLSDMARAEAPQIPKFSSVLQKPQRAEPPALSQGVTIMPAKVPSFASSEVTELPKPSKPYSLTVTSEPIKVPPMPKTLTSYLIPQPKSRIIVTVKALAPEPVQAEPVLAPEPVQAEPVSAPIPLPPSLLKPNATALPGVTESIATAVESMEEEPEAPMLGPEEETEAPMPTTEAETEASMPGTEAETEAPMPATEEEPEAPMLAAEAEPEAPMLTTEAEPEVADTQVESAPSQTKPQAILFTQEKERKEGSVGLEASYTLLFDGTDNDSLSHTLFLKPYVTYKSFALNLQSSVSTADFSTFTSNVTPLPAGSLAKISYGFKYISSLRFGYSSSPFFLALDNNQYHSSLSDQYFAPRFGESAKLGLFNRIEMGSFSTNIYFDDLYLTNILATPSKYQVGSFALEYAKAEGYRFSASLGTLAKIENSPSRVVNLYPHVNFLFPLVDVRTTQLSLLVSASGYLPVYPNVDFDKFVDPALSTLFPNYQLSAGLSLKQGPFSAKLLGSLREGENRNLLTSDLAYAIKTSYDSVFDIFAEAGFAGEHLNARLTVNLPFTNGFALASVTGESYQADFSQLTLSYKQKGFTFSFGVQEVGISETINGILDGSNAFTTLFGGARATSFLSAGYSFGDLAIKAKVAYPASPTVYTTPKVTITASYKLGVQF